MSREKQKILFFSRSKAIEKMKSRKRKKRGDKWEIIK